MRPGLRRRGGARRDGEAGGTPTADDRCEVHRTVEGRAARGDLVSRARDLRVRIDGAAVADNESVGEHAAAAGAVEIEIVLDREVGCRNTVLVVDIAFVTPARHRIETTREVREHDIASESVAAHARDTVSIEAPDRDRHLAGVTEVDDVPADV